MNYDSALGIPSLLFPHPGPEQGGPDFLLASL